MSLIDIDRARTDDILRAIAGHEDTDRIHVLWEIHARLNPRTAMDFETIVAEEDLEDASRDAQVAAFAEAIDTRYDVDPSLDDDWQASLEAKLGDAADAVIAAVDDG